MTKDELIKKTDDAIQELVYSKYDLQIIIQEVHNPYLTIKNIPNWDGYGKELYLSEEGIMEI